MVISRYLPGEPTAENAREGEIAGRDKEEGSGEERLVQVIVVVIICSGTSTLIMIASQ